MFEKMKKPNFFIIGAPKCGTTALARYLSEHNDIFMCQPKEPNYFSSDLPMRQPGVESIDEYLNLFSDADDSCKAVGEASVWYLYSK